MKDTARRILALLIIIALVGSLAGCGKTVETTPTEPTTITVTVDGNGLATWSPVEGAVHYVYSIVDAAHVSDGERITTDTQIQLPEGHAVHVCAVFADGSMSDRTVSDYYGATAVRDDEPAEEPPAVQENEFDITLDEKGWARWEPVEGAVEYICWFMTVASIISEEVTVTETTIRVPLKHCVYVTPVMENGSTGPHLRSDYHGSTPLPERAPDEYPFDPYYSTSTWDTATYDVIANIDLSTVRTDETGNVTFTATGPKGEPMRFSGTGITVEKGSITFAPNGSLYALDAIGRICAYGPIVSDPGNETNQIILTGGYTFNDQTSVQSVDDLFLVWPMAIPAYMAAQYTFDFTSVMGKQPNMIGIGAFGDEPDPITLSKLVIYYDESSCTTEIASTHLDYNFYGTYLEGDYYDPSREVYDSTKGIYTFYLMLVPGLQDAYDSSMPDFMLDSTPYMSRAVIDIPMERYEIGALKDPDGNIVDKETYRLEPGSTLEITVAGQTYDMELPILPRAKGVQTLHQLTPYANIPSLGDVTTLVVPLQWSDYQDPMPGETMDMLRQKLGRVVDESGTVTDHSADIYSLSAYYDTVSLGKYHIESFLTDWVTLPYTFEEAQYTDLLFQPLPDEIFRLVKEMYPDMDWTRFDRNGDGILDSVIYISAAPEADYYWMTGIAGGAHHLRGYDASRARTPEDPALKDFIAVGLPVLRRDRNVILHEYAHNFGLIDYYDVTYSGIDAVGGFDMQSGSYGDWNAYSKYSVGWIEPEIVTDLTSGESVEITIGSQSRTGDAIVIPAAGTDFDGPFGEYMLIDLFTATGVNEADAARSGLSGAVGVRIYHVNAHMESRTLTDKYGDEAPIGTPNVANDHKGSGRFHIELLQRGGNNTFTDTASLRTMLTPADLFRPGDVFVAESYSEFLTDGRMDDGSVFGYTIEIVSIEENGADSTATIRITRN